MLMNRIQQRTSSTLVSPTTNPLRRAHVETTGFSLFVLHTHTHGASHIHFFIIIIKHNSRHAYSIYILYIYIMLLNEFRASL